jgi:hypothetical protein
MEFVPGSGQEHGMRKWILPTLLLFAISGCDRSGTDRAASDPQADRPKASPELLGMWRWPSDAGEPRDLAQDQEECLGLANAETSVIRKTGVMWDCMRRKGWHRLKPGR